MNARESLAADRDAEQAYDVMNRTIVTRGDVTPDSIVIESALYAIAAELRAARVYANYLEGRTATRTSEKRKAAAE